MLDKHFNPSDITEIRESAVNNKYVHYLCDFLESYTTEVNDVTIKVLASKFIDEYPVVDFDENNALGTYFLYLSLLIECSEELESLLIDIMLACEEYDHRVLEKLDKESVKMLLLS